MFFVVLLALLGLVTAVGTLPTIFLCWLGLSVVAGIRDQARTRTPQPTPRRWDPENREAEVRRINAGIEAARQIQLQRQLSTLPTNQATAQSWYMRIITSVCFPTLKPPQVDLRELADGTSALMELLNTTPFHEKAARIRLVNTALEGVLTIQRELRGDKIEDSQPARALKEGGDCIVCYEQPADMVIMPCKHLALCTACCDAMGISGRNGAERCPICRAGVLDRMKIFRS